YFVILKYEQAFRLRAVPTSRGVATYAPTAKPSESLAVGKIDASPDLEQLRPGRRKRGGNSTLPAQPGRQGVAQAPDGSGRRDIGKRQPTLQNVTDAQRLRRNETQGQMSGANR